MSERSRVTITLGHTGQVVKKGGGGQDGSLTDRHPVVGSKRSARERLGNNVDSSVQFNNKRFRGDARTSSSLVGNGLGIQLSKNDLRHKIMKKTVIKQGKSIRPKGDLRNILSRSTNSSKNSTVIRQQQRPEPVNTRQSYRESFDAKRQQYIEPVDRERLITMNRTSCQNMDGYSIQQKHNSRDFNMQRERDGGGSFQEIEDVSRCEPNASGSGIMPNVSSVRATTFMMKPESRANPYNNPSWSLDQLRRRSPDKALVSNRRLSSAPSNEELLRQFTVRVPQDANTRIVSRDPFEFSRPVTTTSFLTRPAPSAEPVETKAPGLFPAPIPQPGSLVQRSSYAVDDKITVDGLLKMLGLERYAILFRAEEVDMYSLKRMTENDLKEIGLPMGPRKKILLALQPRPRMQA